ncbi:unnamed protein product [Durusdinium trenchii]|uniref:Chitotriosidase-1 (Chitinase-1) n=2 Tax=Durusdinium trenchii TaxID=1381693 RepID=A0ABP0RPH6_9DINO
MMHILALLMLGKSLAPCMGSTAGAGFVQYKRKLSQTVGDDFCQGKTGLHAAPAGAEGNEDCRGYYNCWHGNEAMQLCGSGLRFNPATKNCDWKDNVLCEVITTVSPSTTVAPSTTTPSTTGQGTTTSPATTSSSSTDPSEFCQGKTGLYAAPVGMVGNLDCRGYFNCFHGNEPMQLCAEGQRFNSNLKICDWSANVPCTDTSTTDGGTTTTTTTAAPSTTLSTTVGSTTVSTTAASTTVSTTVSTAASTTAGSTTVSSTTGGNSGKIFVAYFANWFQWWPEPYKFMPSDIPADKITHLNYAFAMIHSSTFKIRHFEDNDVSNWGTGTWETPCSQQSEWCSKGLYEQVNDLKATHPHLKTLISIGGWSFNLPESEDAESATRMKRLDSGWSEYVFSDMVSTAENRQKFVDSAIDFCRTWGFDGLDLDWEYPGYIGRGGRTTDKANFALLLSELRSAFDAEGSATGKAPLLLTAAVGIGPTTADNAYDVPALNQYLDFINLMTYDMYGGWSPEKTAIHSQLYAGPGDSFGDGVPLSGEYAVNDWISRGASVNKLALGLVTYSRSFQLQSSAAGQGPGAAGVGYGATQPYSKQKGLASYYEILTLISQGAQKSYDASRCGAYLQKDDLWMGFDDEESVRCKAAFIKEKGLIGGLMWDLPEDDFPNGSPITTAFSQALGL